MAVQYVLNTETTTLANDDARELLGSDVLYVAKGARLSALGTGASAVQLVGTSTAVTVLGDLFAADGPAISGVQTSGNVVGITDIRIGASGSVVGAKTAIHVGTSALVDNAGEIIGSDRGVLLQGGGGDVVNAGTIRGEYGVEALGGGANIVNTGSIHGAYIGLRVDGGSNDVVNAGTIHGQTYAILLESAFGSDTLLNEGLIVSGQYAVWGGQANETLTNAGQVSGAVWLNGGADLYDGRAGHATGLVNGGDGTDTLLGGDGAERFFGGKEDDEIDGGAGSDTIQGGLGADLLEGGAGIDLLSYRESNAAVSVNLGTGDATGGTATGDTISGFEGLIGSTYNDTLLGGNGAERLLGDAGADYLAGGIGNDRLTGDAGADTLVGGAGADVLRGGDQADIFVFAAVSQSTVAALGRDRILDFQAGVDDIQLAAIDAATGMAGNQAFVFLGTAAFSGVQGQLRYEQTAGFTQVTGDVNGDKAADFAILLDGLLTLTAGDFVL